MKNRHFEKLTKETSIQIALTPTLTFKNLLVLDVMKHEETLKTVADAAAKEFLIETALDKIIIGKQLRWMFFSIKIRVCIFKTFTPFHKLLNTLFQINLYMKFYICSIVFYKLKM